MAIEAERPLGIRIEIVTQSERVETEINRGLNEGLTLEEIGTQAITQWAMGRRVKRETSKPQTAPRSGETRRIESLQSYSSHEPIEPKNRYGGGGG